jgi:hypothetical protein
LGWFRDMLELDEESDACPTHPGETLGAQYFILLCLFSSVHVHASPMLHNHEGDALTAQVVVKPYLVFSKF